MKNKLTKLIDSYWKFDEDQQPSSSYHDKQDLLLAIDNLFNPKPDEAEPVNRNERAKEDFYKKK